LYRRHKLLPEIIQMLRNLFFALSWLVFVSLSTLDTPAQDAGQPSGKAEATAAQRELVQQLGNRSFHTRDRAEEELASQGLAAEAALIEALEDPDAEIRQRARCILERVRGDAPTEDAAVPSGEAQATADLRELVQQLGAPSFHRRDRVEEELASQGLAAEATLMEALSDPDLEIRWRARKILNRVRANAFEARLAAFIADVDGSRQVSLPGWKQFRDLVGDGRNSREMFAEMTRYEGALLSAYEKRAPELPKLFAARVAWLQSQAAIPYPDSRSVPRPSLTTFLLIGCDKTAKDHSQGVSQLYQLLSNSAAMQSIGTHTQPPVLQSLLEKWVTYVASSGSYKGMAMALKYDLNELGLQQATKLLEGGTTSSSSLRYAMIAVGRFGGEEHVRLLTPLLENKTVCNRWSNSAIKKEGTINTQVRDVALVVLLHLSGKDPKQYGFKLLQENPETLYHSYSCGFVDDEEREAAHAKWAADSKAGVE
jgi:hypothetical protein